MKIENSSSLLNGGEWFVLITLAKTVLRTLNVMMDLYVPQIISAMTVKPMIIAKMHLNHSMIDQE